MFNKIKQLKYRADVSSYLNSRLGIGRSALSKITEINANLMNECWANQVNIPEASIRLCIKCAYQFLLTVEAQGVAPELDLIYGSNTMGSVNELARTGMELLLDGSRKDLTKQIICATYNPKNEVVIELVNDIKTGGLLDIDIYEELIEVGHFALSDKLTEIVAELPEWLKDR